MKTRIYFKKRVKKVKKVEPQVSKELMLLDGKSDRVDFRKSRALCLKY